MNNVNQLTRKLTWVFGAALAAAALLAACSSNQATPPRAPEAVPVRVAAAEERRVPVQIATIGRAEAYSTVGVKSLVEGQLLTAHFREGQEVRRGSRLFTIDPRPFEAALAEARARRARDAALAEKADKDAVRYKELVARDLVSRQQYDQAVADAVSLKATVKADQAQVDDARLRLSFCYINAPITGRAGSLLVYAGNIVKANADTPLVVIHQVDPIYVNFAVPEQNLAAIKQAMAAGRLEVTATAPGDAGPPVRGRLTFIDNAVDTTTGTIVLKGTFANGNHRLWPGQFVNTVLTLRWIENAVVVPAEAVQAGQQGSFVFVVREGGSAEARPVTTGFAVGPQMVIERGVCAGERVVTDGQVRLTPGAKVSIRADAPAPGAAAPTCAPPAKAAPKPAAERRPAAGI